MTDFLHLAINVHLSKEAKHADPIYCLIHSPCLLVELCFLIKTSH
uniref:Uncharacterized protein n=1 Tax=Arundo donax TaxID=35708 RepID=A0A0A8Z1T7_ARUDO